MHEKKLLNLSLKYRIFAGKVLVHDKLRPAESPECEVFAFDGHDYYCNPSNLGNLELQNDLAEEEMIKKGLSIEHPEIGHTIGNKGPLFAVYGKIGKSSFPSFYSRIKELSEQGRGRFVYRHLVDGSCRGVGKGSELPGFGLEIEVKRWGQEGLVVDGISFSPPPEAFREDDHGLIGVQLISALLKSDSPLELLSTVSENVPLLIDYLSRISLNAEVLEKAERLSQHYMLPETIIAINGAEVTPENFNIQSLLEMLVEYQGLIRRHLAPINAQSLADELMKHTFNLSPMRFDIRGPEPIPLNNLEKEGRYKAWPSMLQSLLRPPMGQFYPLARNLVVITALIDLDSVGEPLIQALVNIVTQMVPLQVMILPFSSSGRERVAAETLYAVSVEYDTARLVDFLVQLMREQSEAGLRVSEVYSKSPMRVPLGTLLKKSDASKLADAAEKFAHRLGALRSTQIFINGRPINYDEAVILDACQTL